MWELLWTFVVGATSACLRLRDIRVRHTAVRLMGEAVWCGMREDAEGSCSAWPGGGAVGRGIDVTYQRSHEVDLTTTSHRGPGFLPDVPRNHRSFVGVRRVNRCGMSWWWWPRKHPFVQRRCTRPRVSSQHPRSWPKSHLFSFHRAAFSYFPPNFRDSYITESVDVILQIATSSGTPIGSGPGAIMRLSTSKF